MSGAEVESIIELICDKIGMAVDSVADAVPLFAIHGLITSGVPMLLCLIYFIATGIFLFMLIRMCLGIRRRGDVFSEVDGMSGMIVIGIFLSLIAIFAGWNFFSYVEEFLGWLLAPQSEMFYEILRML